MVLGLAHIFAHALLTPLHSEEIILLVFFQLQEWVQSEAVGAECGWCVGKFLYSQVARIEQTFELHLHTHLTQGWWAHDNLKQYPCML